MKKIEFAIIAGIYVACAGIALIITNYINYSEKILGFVVSAIVVSQIAGLLYYKRVGDLVPNTVKVHIGILISLLFLSLGAILQSVYKVFTFPFITLSFGTIGTSICPFVMSNIVPKELLKHVKKSADMKT